MRIQPAEHHQHGRLLRPSSPAITKPKGFEPGVSQDRPESKAGSDRPDSGGDVPGIIRLLEEGHFKGVADVRLRINFFQELTSRAEARATALLPGALSALADQISGALGSMPEGAGLDESALETAGGLAEEFLTAVQEMGEQLSPESALDRQALEVQLREAFDVLVTGLRELIAPPPPADAESTEPPTDEPPATDPLAGLVETFEQALDELDQSLTADLSLPELSPPAGNGAAYAKFLAIYNSLVNPDTIGDEPPNDGTDLTA